MAHTTTILDLPRELLAFTLGNLPPSDIVRFGATCHDAHAFVAPTNQLLWQAAFCSVFDDPRETWATLTPTACKADGYGDAWDWFERLRAWMSATRYLNGTRLEHDMQTGLVNEEEVVRALLEVILNAKSALTDQDVREGRTQNVDDRGLSASLAMFPSRFAMSKALDTLLRGTPKALRDTSVGSAEDDEVEMGSDEDGDGSVESWFARLRRRPGRPVTRSMVSKEWDNEPRSEAGAKLHCLAGLTDAETKDRRAMAKARRVVYNWNTTNAQTGWGPFKADGSGEVDWVRLEAAMSVVTLQFSHAVMGRLALPQGFCFSVPNRVLIDPAIPHDWAGVSGPWSGTYVFLNWENLVEFNLNQREDNSRPDLNQAPESCGGLMKLELKLTPELAKDPALEPNLPYCADLPPLYFQGISRSSDFQMMTRVRGMACLCVDGRSVRWRYIVSYSGSDQWQLEGVQPGGVRSGCVYGLWTSCHHEDGSPVGPFMYTRDDLCKPTSIVLVRSDRPDFD